MSSKPATLESLKEFISQQLSVSKEDITATTRIGEDLSVVGDDAEEFMTAFARDFDVDLSKFNFTDYFPSEATSSMNYYLAAKAKKKTDNALLRFINTVESAIWRVMSNKISFKSLQVQDLLNAAKEGCWANKL